MLADKEKVKNGNTLFGYDGKKVVECKVVDTANGREYRFGGTAFPSASGAARKALGLKADEKVRPWRFWHLDKANATEGGPSPLNSNGAKKKAPAKKAGATAAKKAAPKKASAPTKPKPAPKAPTSTPTSAKKGTPRVSGNVECGICHNRYPDAREASRCARSHTPEDVKAAQDEAKAAAGE